MSRKIINYTFFIGIILVSNHQILAQNENYYYENAVFKEDIKTVLLYREGFELSNPVIELGEDVHLILKFDDLSG